MATQIIVSHRRTMVFSRYSRLNFSICLFLIMSLSGCAALDAQRQKEEQLNAAEVSMNRTQIFVSNSDIAYPHRVLGKLEYSEPFSPDAIDTEKINNKLRSMAIERYGDEVDAISNAHSDVNDDGTQVNASGEALRITSPCSFCRHKSPDVIPGQVDARH